MTKAQPSPRMILTDVERKCLDLRAQGLIAKQIGPLIPCSHRTIETHFKNIITKNGCKTSYEAVARYVREKAWEEQSHA